MASTATLRRGTGMSPWPMVRRSVAPSIAAADVPPSRKQSSQTRSAGRDSLSADEVFGGFCSSQVAPAFALAQYVAHIWRGSQGGYVFAV